MRKVIHSDDSYGLFDKGPFINFISNLKDAELLSHDTLYPTQYSDDRKSEVWTYHLQQEEVTLQYRHIATERIMGGSEVYVAKVIACGRDDKIGEFEKLLSDANFRYNPQKS